MTVWSVDDISRWDMCPRLPAAYKQYGDRWPIREAAKRQFYSALSVRPYDPELAETHFLTLAASDGFEYPTHADPYKCARDHGSWVSGALHLVEELELTPTRRVRECPVSVRVFSDPVGGLHLFRVVESFHAPARIRWPELVVAAFYSPAFLTTHLVALPRVSADGRLHSPLSWCYRHPLTGHYRLARHGSEKDFASKWRRMGRWQAQDEDQLSWSEWREGVDRDQCLGKCITHWEVTLPEPGECKEIRAEVQAVLGQLQEGGTVTPRKREMCHTCIGKNVCHPSRVGEPEIDGTTCGNGKGSHERDRIGDADQSVSAMRGNQSTVPFSPE